MSDLYHKIQSVYKRDPSTDFKTFLEGQFSLPEFEYLANNIWEWTEKFEGMCLNLNYAPLKMLGNKLSLYGKTKDAQIPDGLRRKLVDYLGIGLNLFHSHFGLSTVDLFLEGVGPGIHGGGKYGKNYDCVLFDVLIDGWWLRRKDVIDIGNKLGLKVTPVISRGTLYELIKYVKRGFLSTWGNFYAEGIVARPLVELRTRGGDRIITKLKYIDFRKL